MSFSAASITQSIPLIKAFFVGCKLNVSVTLNLKTLRHTGRERVMEWQRTSLLAAQGDEVSVSHVEHII